MGDSDNHSRRKESYNIVVKIVPKAKSVALDVPHEELSNEKTYSIEGSENRFR